MTPAPGWPGWPGWPAAPSGRDALRIEHEAKDDQVASETKTTVNHDEIRQWVARGEGSTFFKLVRRSEK